MVERSDDGRYIVVDGVRWRASDPLLPDELRSALVSELMTARRAVRQALRDDDTAALRAARDRVHDAKVALGERGKPWWEEAGQSDVESRRAATERALSQRPED